MKNIFRSLIFAFSFLAGSIAFASPALVCRIPNSKSAQAKAIFDFSGSQLTNSTSILLRFGPYTQRQNLLVLGHKIDGNGRFAHFTLIDGGYLQIFFDPTNAFGAKAVYLAPRSPLKVPQAIHFEDCEYSKPASGVTAHN